MGINIDLPRKYFIAYFSCYFGSFGSNLGTGYFGLYLGQGIKSFLPPRKKVAVFILVWYQLRGRFLIV